MERCSDSDPAIHVLVAGVLYLRVLDTGDLFTPTPHALVGNGDWRPFIGVLAQCAGHVSLFLFDSDESTAAEVAEVDVGMLSVQDIQVVDDSLFGGCFGFRLSLRAIAESMRNFTNPTNRSLAGPKQHAIHEYSRGTLGRECTTISGSLPADLLLPDRDGLVPELGHAAPARCRRRSKSTSHTTTDLGSRFSNLFPDVECVANSTPSALYFAALRASERNSWVGQLRRHARAFQLSAALPPAGSTDPLAFRVERCLGVRILGAQGLAMPCSATAMVVAGGNLLAQTDAAVNATAPRWDNASFCFGGLEPISNRLFVLVRQTVPGGDSGGLLGYAQIPLATLRRGHGYSGWYPLSYGDLAAVDCELGAHLRLAPNVRPACKRETRKRDGSGAGSTNSAISAASSRSSSILGGSCCDTAVPDTQPSMPFRSGDVQVEVRYDETIVLCQPAYQDVTAILLDTDPTLIFRLAELIPGSADWLVETITKIAIWSNCAESWIETLVCHELGARADRDPALLFRGTTVATRAMDTLMKVVGLGFVDRLVGDVVRRVTSNECACEVDPTRLPSSNSVDVHWRALMRLLQELWQGIEDGTSSCPPIMRRVFCSIRRVASTVFDRKYLGQVRYSCISSFVFLRLLCPAMLAPKAFGLVYTVPSAACLRTLTLLAKGIQCAANLSGSVGKEPYMQPMNSFVQSCIPKLKLFIDTIAEPPDRPDTVGECVPIDGKHELAVLCAFIHSSRSQIRGALAAKYCLQTPPTPGAGAYMSMPASPTEGTHQPSHVLLAQVIGVGHGTLKPRHMSDSHAPAALVFGDERLSDAKTVPSSPSEPATAPNHPSSTDTLRAHQCAAPLEYLAYSAVERLIIECGSINNCVTSCLKTLPPQEPMLPPCPKDLF